MKKIFGLRAASRSLLAAVLVSGLAMAPGAGIAAEPGADKTAGFSRTEIETIVREYLIANPEIMLEVQDALEAKQRDQQRSPSWRGSAAPATTSSTPRMTASMEIPTASSRWWNSSTTIAATASARSATCWT